MQILKYFFSGVRRKFLVYLWQLNCLISPNKISTFHLLNGLKFDYPLKSGIGFELSIGIFEKSEIGFVIKALKPGDIFIDVGANAGIFTIIAAKKVQNHGHIYAFEPDQRNLKLLRHNLTINNLTNVTILECALSNIKGKTKFAIATDGAMNSFVKTNRKDQQIIEWQIVEVTTLDDFVEEHKISNINFIKIDTEGAEKLIFEGGKNLLSTSEPIIVMFEASDLNTYGFGYLVKDFLEEIPKSNLRLYYFNKDGLPVLTSGFNERFGNSIYNFIATNRLL